jgi:CubicO group peptidase (beta-lactamase class C family)
MLMALLAGAALAAAPASPAQPAPAAATPAPAARPQGPPPADPAAEAAARRLLEVIGAGDEARARAFFAEAFSPESERFEPRERTLARLLALTRQSGGVEIGEWHPEGGRIFFEGRTRRGAVPVQGMVGVEGGRIMGFDLQRNPLARGEGAPAWPPAPGATAEQAVQAIEREIDWRARAELFSGAVLIAHRGRPVLERAWGLARRGPDAAATPATLFSTASASKMLTSAAIGRLIDQGRLSLDTKVSDAVPALASAPGADGVTIRDLLGHRASYGEYFSETEQDPLIARHARATELLRLIEGRAPERAPEGRIAYSNANYLVLAAAIEAASGRSYYEHVEAEILRPLGMTATRFGTAAARPAGAATGWVKDEVSDPLGLGAWSANDARMGGFRGGPAGGAWSTARDMWTLVDALAAGRVVRPETLQAMWGDRRRMGRNLGAALGFMFRGAGAEPGYFGHSGGGGNAGVSTSVFTTPDREWSVVVLSNFSSPAGEMLGGQIMDYLAGLPRQ